MGRAFELNMQELNNMFSFTNHGTRRVEPGLNLLDLWYSITRKTQYHPSRSKASNIRDPALRYIHKFMTHSIFGRGLSVGVCNKQELYILNAMVQGEDINTGFWMIDHMQRVMRQSKGDICIGGMVTMIAMQLGLEINERELTRVEGNMDIDLDIIVSMGMAKKQNGRVVLRQVGAGVHDSDEESDDAEEEANDVPEDQPEHDTAAAPDVEPPRSRATMDMVLARLDEWRLESNTHMDKLQADQTRMLENQAQFQAYVRERFDALDAKLDA